MPDKIVWFRALAQIFISCPGVCCGGDEEPVSSHSEAWTMLDDEERKALATYIINAVLE